MFSVLPLSSPMPLESVRTKCARVTKVPSSCMLSENCRKRVFVELFTGLDTVCATVIQSNPVGFGLLSSINLTTL